MLATKGTMCVLPYLGYPQILVSWGDDSCQFFHMFMQHSAINIEKLLTMYTENAYITMQVSDEKYL